MADEFIEYFTKNHTGDSEEEDIEDFEPGEDDESDISINEDEEVEHNESEEVEDEEKINFYKKVYSAEKAIKQEILPTKRRRINSESKEDDENLRKRKRIIKDNEQNKNEKNEEDKIKEKKSVKKIFDGGKKDNKDNTILGDDMFEV
jgi:hypothetical protein